MHTPSIRNLLSGLALAAPLALGACTRPESEKIGDPSLALGDSATRPLRSTLDSLKAGTDQDFLRALIDRRQVLIGLASRVADRADASAEVRNEARQLEQRQKAARDTLNTMLERTYRESRMPTISREHETRIDGVLLERGASLDRAFGEAVIEHHTKDVELMDAIMPQLTDPELKALTQRLRAEYARAAEALRGRIVDR